MPSAFARGAVSTYLLPSLSQSMVGSDAAELLMQDCRRQDKYKRQGPAATLMGLTDDEWASRQPGTMDLITGEVPPVVETQAQIVEKFTKLLYYGRKKVSGEWDPGRGAEGFFLGPVGLFWQVLKGRGGQEVTCGCGINSPSCVCTAGLMVVISHHWELGGGPK